MIYLIYGSDRVRGRAKVRGYLAALKKKHPEANTFYFDDDNFNGGELASLAESQGLFFGKFLVILEGVLNHQDYGEKVEELVPQLAQSPNLFVIWDELVPKARLEKLKKLAEKVEEFNVKAEVKKEGFNIFSVTDSIVARDRRAAWLALTQALRAGVPAEEVFWKWWWQLKTIRLAAADTAGARATLKPFVYNKALAAGRHYQGEEVVDKISTLAALYHRARFESKDLADELEYFALTL